MNKAAFDKVLMPLNNLWQGMDKNKKIRFGIISALIIIVIVICTVVFSHKEYSVLYKNLDTKEAGEIYNKLQEMEVEVKTQGGGTILVPKLQEDSLRLQLAAEGYPESGLNYDIFQNSTGFGTTDFEKQKYLQFQLQERLQNSIKALDMVENAIVTLNIPDNSSFVLKEDKQNTTASVILSLKDKTVLKDDQIKGIEGLVAKSVPGLTDDNVFIIDNYGNSLKSNINDEAAVASSLLDLEHSTSEKLQKQVLSLLEPVFGIGKVNAGVRVSLDFDKQTTESVRYDPVGDKDGGIPISQSIENETVTNDGETGNIGQDANGGAPQYAGTDNNSGKYSKTNETVNYEVNQIKERIQKAEGKIKDISVSVLLDENNLQAGADQKVKEIVAGAIGISKDNVTVQSISFNGTSSINQILLDAEKTNKQMKRALYLRNAIIFASIGVIILFIVLMILKPFKKKKEFDDELEQTTGGGLDITINEDGEEIKLNKSSKREFIERSIKKNPELVAQLLRNWLNEEMR